MLDNERHFNSLHPLTPTLELHFRNWKSIEWTNGNVAYLVSPTSIFAALNFRVRSWHDRRKAQVDEEKGMLGGVARAALREGKTTTGTRKYRRKGMGFFVLCENSPRGDGLWHQTKPNIASTLTSLPCPTNSRGKQEGERNLVLTRTWTSKEAELGYRSTGLIFVARCDTNSSFAFFHRSTAITLHCPFLRNTL